MQLEMMSEQPDTLQTPTTAAEIAQLASASSDYDLVRQAIRYLTENWNEQPDLNQLAAHLGVSGTHCQKLFKRWCGLSPKEFVQAITIDNARQRLAAEASLLDCAHDVGLSGSSRLHDLFVDHEAMTPGDFKRGGAGITLTYSFHPTPFGEAMIVMTPRGLAGLAFINDDTGQTRRDVVADMAGRWPAATLVEQPDAGATVVAQMFDPSRWAEGQPIRIVLIGTDFEVRVWETLLKIPVGQVVSYSDVAKHIGKPTASRAVGTAVGRNPLSFVVPCHRVLRSDGNLGGYHWGLTRKRALIGWEAGQVKLRAAA